MTTQLSPQQAANIARHVYRIRTQEDIQRAARVTGGLGMGDDFEVDGDSRFEGTSGPLIFRKSSGFGFIARGKGKRQGETLIATRGTVTMRDWWTDANFGFHSGPSGHLVHAGFDDTFDSFVEELRKYFAKNNPSHVHCVGHSLGGALATLTADFVSENGISGVSLYTFGCPRVGVHSFANNLTRKIGAANIQRVYHDADPVSMIPLFPFTHTPVSDNGIELNWSGARVAVPAHYMESYLTSIGDASWLALRRSPERVDWQQKAKEWMDVASSHGLTVGFAFGLWMITKALGKLLAKIALGVVGTALAVGITALDQLAWLLHQGAMASKKIAEELGALLGAVLKFIGRGVTAVVNTSLGFIRWVLGMLFQSIQTVVRNAVNQIPFG